MNGTMGTSPQCIKKLATIADPKQFQTGSSPGLQGWLDFIDIWCERWAAITLGHYDPADLRSYDAEHLVRKVQSYLGPRPVHDEELRRRWDDIHRRVVNVFVAWMPELVEGRDPPGRTAADRPFTDGGGARDGAP